MAGVQVWGCGYTCEDMDVNRLWRGTAVLLFGTIAFVALLIGSGWFDPQPFGDLRWQKSVTAMTVGAGGREVLWLADEIEEVFSVRATAVYQSGEKDIVYGLVLGNDDDYLAVAVSPLGYATVWQGDMMLMPLQPWPYVRTGDEPNEIWIDVGEDEVVVRLNREVLWVGEVIVAGGVGVMGESWDETAVVEIPTIQLFAP